MLLPVLFTVPAEPPGLNSSTRGLCSKFKNCLRRVISNYVTLFPFQLSFLHFCHRGSFASLALLLIQVETLSGKRCIVLRNKLSVDQLVVSLYGFTLAFPINRKDGLREQMLIHLPSLAQTKGMSVQGNSPLRCATCAQVSLVPVASVLPLLSGAFQPPSCVCFLDSARAWP